MKKLQKLLCLLLVAALTLSSALLLSACGDEPAVEANALQSHEKGALYNTADYVATKKQAMIFMPGLMASAFYETNSSTQMWGMGRFASLVSQLSKVSSGTQAEKDAFLDATIKTLVCDDEDVPYTKLRIANMEDPDWQDAFGGMKGAYDIIKPVYGEQYDMVVWQYDWRQHNMGAAEQLEKFINEKGYEKVMFFTHSMGGTVVANYLSRSEANRSKVQLFMPFGAPFLGSMDAVTNLFENAGSSWRDIDLDGVNIATEIFKLLNNTSEFPLFDFALAVINNMLGTDFSLTTLARCVSSVYQLLPLELLNAGYYYDSADADMYAGQAAAVAKDGTALSGTELVDFLKTFEWTKKEDKTTFRPVVQDLSSYQNKFVFGLSDVPEALSAGAYSKDGEHVFVTELVPTEYIVGIEKTTLVGCNLNAEGKIINKYYSDYGDGTVPAYSASAGLPLEHERVHLVYGIDHGPLMDDKNGNYKDETGLQYVLGVLSEYIEKTDAEL